MRLIASFFIALLVVFFRAPCVSAGDPEAAFAFALAQAKAREAKIVTAPAVTLDSVVKAIAAVEVDTPPAPSTTALESKLDALSAKVDKLGMGNCICNCGCPTCKCPQTAKSATAGTAAAQQVCTITGYDSFGRAIYSCPPATTSMASTVSYSSPVTYSTPTYYSTPSYSYYNSYGRTVWSDGSVTYDAAPSGGRRCGPIRRLLGLCQ